MCNLLWNDYQCKRKECKLLINKKIMQIRINKCTKLAEKGGAQCSDFWSMLKGNKKKNSVKSINIPNTQTITSDRETIKSSLTEYFKTLGNKNVQSEDHMSFYSYIGNECADKEDQENILNELNLTHEGVATAIAHCNRQ